MIIRFSKEFRKYTNGFEEFVSEETTLGEGFKDACNTYPQLLIHLEENDREACKHSAFKLNGEYVTEEYPYYLPVPKEGVIDVTSDIPTGDSFILKVIVGVVLIVVGAIATYFGCPYGSEMIRMGVMMIVSAAVVEAFFTPEAPSPIALSNPSLLSNSATYTFNGIKNTAASGTPVQIVYGEHRVGGQVLNMYTTSEASKSGYTTETLYAQIGLCEGPINSVSNLEINQNPYYYYNAIESFPHSLDNYFRNGESSQALMPLFSITENTTTINRKIVNTSPPVEYDALAAGAITVYGHAEDDEYRLGLYKLVHVD